MVDLGHRLGNPAQTVHHAAGQRQLDDALLLPGLRCQPSHIGHDAGKVVVRQAVVVLAGHQAQRAAITAHTCVDFIDATRSGRSN